MPVLVLWKGQTEISRFIWEGRNITIGRDSSNDVVIDEPTISRKHATIEFSHDGYHFVDCKSTHGSKINGKSIKKHTLKNGNIIEIGQVQISFSERDKETELNIPPGPAPQNPSVDWAQLYKMMSNAMSAEEGSKRLQALFEISQTLETTTEYHQALLTIIDKAVEIMGAERGFLLLVDADTHRLKVHAARDRKGTIHGIETEKVSRSVIEEVTRSGTPLRIDNAMGTDWGSESAIAHSIHSVMCVPLKVGDTVTGVLYVDHRSRTFAFSEQDLTFFTTFALQAKSVIDNSRAYWELVESLFKASGDLIMVCNKENRIIQANRAAATLLGRKEKDLVSRLVSDFVVSEQRSKALEMGQKTVSQGIMSNQEFLFCGKGGQKIPMSISSFVMRNRQGAPMGSCWIGRDLTEIRTLVDQLIVSNKKLGELNDMKSQFVGMVSHELKTPMSVMKGYVDLMLRGKIQSNSPKHKSALQKILNEINLVSSMVSDLLNLTRIETGKIPLRLCTFDISKLIKEVAESLQIQAREAEVQIEPSGVRKSLTMEGDEEMLRRMVGNFMSNGIKYNRRGGKLTVALDVQEGECTLAFIDQGVGISDEDQQKLFGRFFRADTVREISGTGLGLSIVKAIIDRHKGRVNVESTVGQGTTFRVTLPIHIS